MHSKKKREKSIILPLEPTLPEATHDLDQGSKSSLEEGISPLKRFANSAEIKLRYTEREKRHAPLPLKATQPKLTNDVDKESKSSSEEGISPLKRFASSAEIKLKHTEKEKRHAPLSLEATQSKLTNDGYRRSRSSPDKGISPLKKFTSSAEIKFRQTEKEKRHITSPVESIQTKMVDEYNKISSPRKRRSSSGESSLKSPRKRHSNSGESRFRSPRRKFSFRKSDQEPTPVILSPNIYDEEKFILEMLGDIRVEIRDINYILVIMKAIVATIPKILAKYIRAKRAYIKEDVPGYFQFNEDEVEMILEQIKHDLEIKIKDLTLEHEICELFLNRKLHSVKQSLGFTFPQALQFKNYIETYNANIEKGDDVSVPKCLKDYIFNSKAFKSALEGLCLFILSPPLPLLNLGIIMQPIDFDSGLKSIDFARTTLDKISDEMEKHIGLSENKVKFLAKKIFEKHKYIYCCDYGREEVFSELIKGLCVSLSKTDNSDLRWLQQALDNHHEAFTNVEIRVINESLLRLSLGLIKWSSASTATLEGEQEDLLSKFTTQLQSDLTERMIRIHGAIDVEAAQRSDFDKRRMLQDIGWDAQLTDVEVRASTHSVKPITSVTINMPQGRINPIRHVDSVEGKGPEKLWKM